MKIFGINWKILIKKYQIFVFYTMIQMYITIATTVEV